MKKALNSWLCGCLWLATLPALSQPIWKPTKTTIEFSIRNAGINVGGTFNGFTGMLLFDPAKPETGKLSGTVETATLDTGIGARDSHLRKGEYFDVATFPHISLMSVNLEKKGGNAYIGVFDLTLKGVTRRVTVPFTYSQQGKTGQFLGRFTINRLDYKVGKSNLFLSDNVTISLMVQAQRTEMN